MFGIWLRWLFLLWIGALMCPATAWAGMPAVTFTEVARLRMEVISFFVVGLLLSAGAVQLIWSFLRRDFPRLPQLGYWRSLGVVTLWGLLFVVVLTMISGARELMTPGAWVKDGATYKLDHASETAGKLAEEQHAQQQFAARSVQLLTFGNALRQWAEKHEGELPTREQAETEIEPKRWNLPGLSETRYIYVGGDKFGDAVRIVAYEPQVYAGETLALTASGELLQIPFEELTSRVRQQRAAETQPVARAEEVQP